jgi:hypothetical protein
MIAAFQVEPGLEATLATLYDQHFRGNQQWLGRPDRDSGIAADQKTQLLPLDLVIKNAVQFGRDQLKEWAEGRRLGDPWCIDWTIEKKLLERRARELGAAGFVSGIFLGPPPLTRTPFVFSVDGWIATEATTSHAPMQGESAITRAAFESMARERFDRALTEYCERIEEGATAAGYVRTKALYQAKHWRWLAAYQVCRFSYNALASALAITRRAVEHPITTGAAEIGLTLRNTKTEPACVD